MEYKYVLLKTSWGIVIFLDIEELTEYQFNSGDIEVCNGIFLRVEDARKLNKDVIAYWFRKAFTQLDSKLRPIIGTKEICYVVKNIDFNYCDFQEEALPFAIRGWMDEYYHLDLEPIDIMFDKSKNKYLYPK